MRLIKFQSYKDFSLWDTKRYFNNEISSKYNFFELKELIKESFDKIKCSQFPDRDFKILGVNNQIGLFDAYIEKGNKINQPYKLVKNGFLAYNPYRVNVGSIGLKTQSQLHDLISNAYVVFSCNNNLLPEYLYRVFLTNVFNKIINDNTSGSVRQNLTFEILKNIQIPLPPLEIQNNLVEEYNNLVNLSKEQEERAKQLEQEIENYLLSELGIEIQKTEIKKGLQFVSFKNVNYWGIDKLFGISKRVSNFDIIKLKDNKDIVKEAFRGKSPKYASNSNSKILNQKCIRWNEIEIEHAKSVDDTWLKSIKNNNFTAENDILINSTGEGTIGRCSLITEPFSNLMYDSHVLLLRLNDEYFNQKYFTLLFNSKYIQNQINEVKSAQSTKQTELGLENLFKLEIPLPPLEKQNEIVENIEALRSEIKKMKYNAEANRAKAKENFEKEIFGEG